MITRSLTENGCFWVRIDGLKFSRILERQLGHSSQSLGQKKGMMIARLKI